MWLVNWDSSLRKNNPAGELGFFTEKNNLAGEVGLFTEKE